MKKTFIQVTILSFLMLNISCSFDAKEDIGFEAVPASSAEFSRVTFDKATLVLAIDDSYSMAAKVDELSQNLEGMFIDLLVSGWDIDLHVVSCFYYKQDNNKRKHADTSTIKDKFNFDEKLKLLLTEAKIEVVSDGQDADERCNQSLEKAWSEIKLKNNVNLSLLISNEDDCSRSDENLVLKDVNGSDRNNCAPLTHGRLKAYNGGEDLFDKSLDEWKTAIEGYTKSIWKPQFNKLISPDIYGSSYYVAFFSDLEAKGKRLDPNFSHIYLPIVVDDSKCLSRSLQSQALLEQDRFISENGNLNGFRPEYTVGNMGYIYMDVFNDLKQDTTFSAEEGDLSLCNDLHHVVNKLQKEIKVRGQGLRIQLSRQMDLDATKSLFKGQAIVRVLRPVSNQVDIDRLVSQNATLSAIGLEWTKQDEEHYKLDLYLDTPFIKYDDSLSSLFIQNNRYLVIEGGDKIERLSYAPKEFKDKEESFEINNK